MGGICGVGLIRVIWVTSVGCVWCGACGTARPTSAQPPAVHTGVVRRSMFGCVGAGVWLFVRASVVGCGAFGVCEQKMLSRQRGHGEQDQCTGGIQTITHVL